VAKRASIGLNRRRESPKKRLLRPFPRLLRCLYKQQNRGLRSGVEWGPLDTVFRSLTKDERPERTSSGGLTQDQPGECRPSRFQSTAVALPLTEGEQSK